MEHEKSVGLVAVYRHDSLHNLHMPYDLLVYKEFRSLFNSDTITRGDVRESNYGIGEPIKDAERINDRSIEVMA